MEMCDAGEQSVTMPQLVNIDAGGSAESTSRVSDIMIPVAANINIHHKEGEVSDNHVNFTTPIPRDSLNNSDFTYQHFTPKDVTIKSLPARVTSKVESLT